MKLLLVNPNLAQAVTDVVLAAARAAGLLQALFARHG